MYRGAIYKAIALKYIATPNRNHDRICFSLRNNNKESRISEMYELSGKLVFRISPKKGGVNIIRLAASVAFQLESFFWKCLTIKYAKSEEDSVNIAPRYFIDAATLRMWGKRSILENKTIMKYHIEV